jgi:hypothetical protein
MKAQEDFDGVTVMLNEGVLDSRDDGCPECRELGDGRCEACQAWAEQTGNEITKRVGQRFPGCGTIWLPASEMGSFHATNPGSIRCPADVYEAVPR